MVGKIKFQAEGCGRLVELPGLVERGVEVGELEGAWLLEPGEDVGLTLPTAVLDGQQVGSVEQDKTGAKLWV